MPRTRSSCVSAQHWSASGENPGEEEEEEENEQLRMYVCMYAHV